LSENISKTKWAVVEEEKMIELLTTKPFPR